MVAAQQHEGDSLVELLMSHGAQPDRTAAAVPTAIPVAREVGPLRGLVLADGLWGTPEFATVGARDATVGAGAAACYEVTLLKTGKYVQLGWAAWPA
eukprot:7303325-Prymnesium_polylepis.1